MENNKLQIDVIKKDRRRLGIIFSNNDYKVFRSPNYNYDFNKNTGYFERWGRAKKDDPSSAPGPEIVDLELSTICSGVNNKPCQFCYKKNTAQGKNMDLETFKRLFHKLPRSITQLAAGIGNIDGNPDLFKIFKYCRENDYNQVIPNITINGDRLTDERAELLAKYCGAVAVSYYDKDICYNAVKKLTDLGMTQCNIHYFTSAETYQKAFEVLDDIKKDPRLSKLNAIVMLGLKCKGRAEKGFNRVGDESFKKLVDYCFEHEIRFGFDSCSAPKFIKSIKDNDRKEIFEMMAEPCESGLFSMYISVTGEFYPCSFMENSEGWEKGIDVLNCDDFIKDVWNNPRTISWRKRLLNNKRNCPVYDV